MMTQKEQMQKNMLRQDRAAMEKQKGYEGNKQSCRGGSGPTFLRSSTLLDLVLGGRP